MVVDEKAMMLPVEERETSSPVVKIAFGVRSHGLSVLLVVNRCVNVTVVDSLSSGPRKEEGRGPISRQPYDVVF